MTTSRFWCQCIATLSMIIICGMESSRTSPQLPDPHFIFPLTSYVVFQNFANINPWFDERYHTAEDEYGSGGTPVFAISDGIISYSGPALGYGWLITIDHPRDSVYSLYGHLSTRRDKIMAGEVSRGDRIAYLADDDEDGSGGVYPDWGPHLHFSIRKGSRFDYPGGAVDNRWSAGYTFAHPTALGWLAPSVFILGHTERPPELLYPANGADCEATTVRLEWESEGFSGYVVQLSLDSAFSAIVRSDSGVGDRYLTIGPLSNAETYFWRVRSSRSSWSTAYRFTTCPVTLGVPIRRGWNIISVPLEVRDARVTSLFPEYPSYAFGYENGYHTEDTLVTGRGYWMKFNDQGTKLFNGSASLTDTFTVSDGWNLIGSLGGPVPVSTIVSEPPALVASGFYGFSGGYFRSDTIHPGSGYWVKLHGPGILILSAPAAP